MGLFFAAAGKEAEGGCRDPLYAAGPGLDLSVGLRVGRECVESAPSSYPASGWRGIQCEMTFEMSPVLHVLQDISHLHILRDVALVFAPAGSGAETGGPFELRIEARKRELRRLCRTVSSEQLAQLCTERALFLRLLLASAGARLGAWKSAGEWQPLRRSQLHESLSHDAEQRELGGLERAMDAPQFADYICRAAQRACLGP